MVAHLRPANLRDILVRAKLPPVDRSRVQVRKHVQASKSVEIPGVCVTPLRVAPLRLFKQVIRGDIW